MLDVISFIAIALASALPLMFRRRWWEVFLFAIAGAVLGLLVAWVHPSLPSVVWSMHIYLAYGWTIAAITDWSRNPPRKDGTRPMTGWMVGWAVGACLQALVLIVLLEVASMIEATR